MQVFVFQIRARSTGERIGTAALCPDVRHAEVWHDDGTRGAGSEVPERVWHRVRVALDGSLPTRPLSARSPIVEVLVRPEARPAMEVEFVGMVTIHADAGAHVPDLLEEARRRIFGMPEMPVRTLHAAPPLPARRR